MLKLDYHAQLASGARSRAETEACSERQQNLQKESRDVFVLSMNEQEWTGKDFCNGLDC